MRVIVMGASGMVGSEVIREAIINKEVSCITAIVRKPIGIEHPKLKTIIHQNFMDYTDLEQTFKDQDACIWCIGISQTVVNKEEYRLITYDYTIIAAKAMIKINPDIKFLFLSGMGADTSGKSLVRFASVKGETENTLQKLPFKNLYIIRAGGIIPVRKKDNTPLSEKAALPLLMIFKFIMPSLVITSAELARVMLYLAQYGSDKKTLENGHLKSILREKLS